MFEILLESITRYKNKQYTFIFIVPKGSITIEYDDTADSITISSYREDPKLISYGLQMVYDLVKVIDKLETESENIFPLEVIE